MEFEWDPEKAASNYRKHRIAFEIAVEAFDDPHAVFREDLADGTEFRASVTGLTTSGLLVVVYTERWHNVTRIISARRAEKHEHRLYLRSLREASGRGDALS